MTNWHEIPLDNLSIRESPKSFSNRGILFCVLLITILAGEGKLLCLREARRCIYVLLKLEQACTNFRDLVYVSQKKEQACTNSRDLVYVSQKKKNRRVLIPGPSVWVSKK